MTPEEETRLRSLQGDWREDAVNYYRTRMRESRRWIEAEREKMAEWEQYLAVLLILGPLPTSSQLKDR